jgi:ADP-ribosyl-[dinitrogen reductase] hydrolase
MKRYIRWWKHGHLSSNGTCFDIGSTTRSALALYSSTREPFAGSDDPQAAGNGCIMRLAPVPMFFFPDMETAVRMAGDSSRTTHGAAECIECCRLLSAVLVRALSGAGKEEILQAHSPESFISAKVRRLDAGDYLGKAEKDIRGSGCVVECLEAALWCFHRTDSFKDAILMAANLGDDADTTGAVCGQVAGAHYGETGIPDRWLERLALGTEIRKTAESLSRTTTR